jgi:amino acid transporter
VIALSVAGVSALKWTLPVAGAITALLVILIVAYRQVIATHPDGGGAYAVAKAELGTMPALLAAASLVVDYILTVAVSLAAGAASLASVFPAMRSHELLIALIGLAILCVVNLYGVAESARLLMAPTLVFLIAMVAVIVLGLLQSDPVATVGGKVPLTGSDTIGVLLLLKAFSAGCSSLTGIEAVANAVPTFKAPAVRTAQRTETAIGVILATLLLGLAALIVHHGVEPRSDVTVLAQLAGGAFGDGAAYVGTMIVTALVLGLAANTSFGGLPVLLGLLARDNRAPHLFYLRGDRPVFRVGVVALALAAGLLLWLTSANTDNLVPLYAIGVFIGFTISLVGLARGSVRARGDRWRARAALGAGGAIVTATATVVFLAEKFTEGAWVVVILIPLLIWTFFSIQRYYERIGHQLAIGELPARPHVGDAMVVVPLSGVDRVAEAALTTALSMSRAVVAVSVKADPEEADQLRLRWDEWDPGVPLTVIDSPKHAVIKPLVAHVRTLCEAHDGPVLVLIPEIVPPKLRQEILHNQRGRLLDTALQRDTPATTCSFTYRLVED